MISNSIEIIFLRIYFLLILFILVLLNFFRSDAEGFNFSFYLATYLLVIAGLLFTFLNSLFAIIISAGIATFYIQRIIVLIIGENYGVYYDYIKFFPEDYSNAVNYILLCIIFLGIGIIASNFIFRKVSSVKMTDDGINEIGILRLGMIISIPMYVLNIFFFYNRIGIVGELYSQDHSMYLWLKKIPEILSICSVISIIYFKKNKIMYRLALSNLIMLAILSIMAGSKGYLLSTILLWYVVKKYKNEEINKKFILIILVSFILSIFLLFPIMSAIRDSIINQSIRPVEFNPIKFILNFSYRLNNYESVILWIKNDGYFDSNLRSIFSDAIEIVNGFWIGDLISYQQVDLSKYQLMLGHGLNRMGELGGHSETLGGIASSFVYFGYLGGLVFFMVWGFILRTLEINIKNKIYLSLIIYFYAVVWFLSGGNILIHSSFSLLIIFTLMYKIIDYIK